MEPADRIASSTIPWTQLKLWPDDVIEITLKVGIVLESDHLQWQITTRNPKANTLLGMLSSPALTSSQWPKHFDVLCSALRSTLEQHTSPF